MTAPEPPRDILRDNLAQLGELNAEPTPQQIATARQAAASLVSVAIGPAEHRDEQLVRSLLEDLFAAGPAWGHGALVELVIRAIDAVAAEVGASDSTTRAAVWAHILRVTAQPADTTQEDS
jgi:hypothetical protein